MKAMTYLIRFEESLDLGDIDLFLKKIKSHVRLEIGDKIALSFASFLEDDKDRIVELMGYLFEKSIYRSEYSAFFEISDIVYNHGFYDDDDEFYFYGIITLKGK